MFNDINHIEVKNLKTKKKIACSCPDFLSHWKNHAGNLYPNCSKLGCDDANDEVLGAEVIKCHGNLLSTPFIIPLCKKCSTIDSNDCFKIKNEVKLVPIISRFRCSSGD